MRRIAMSLLCLLTFGAAGAAAQVGVDVVSAGPADRGHSATEADVLCAGMMTREQIPYDTYVISGKEADPQTVWARGQYVYINHGSGDGVKVGDQYMIMREQDNFIHVQYFDKEHSMARKLGTMWADVGRLRVVVVEQNTSIAQVTYACTYVQRGDYVRPAVDYPLVPFRPLKDLDQFAPPSGKETGRVVKGKNVQASAERGEVVYVNLTGVKAGDYIRFYRPTAPTVHAIYQIGGMADHVFGFGSTPHRWRSKDLPREVLGEGVVLRTTPTSASVLIFNELREIYLGDWVEVE